VTDEFGKDLEGSGRGLILRYYTDILRLEGLRKTSVGTAGLRDLNPRPPEREAGMLTIRPTVSYFLTSMHKNQK
jgi:hypothetical protein